jgi:hypothetical protein
MPTPQTTQPLADVFYQISLDERGITAEVIDEYVRSHPDYADEITAFAVELAVEEFREAKDAEAAEPVIDHATQKRDGVHRDQPFSQQALSRPAGPAG